MTLQFISFNGYDECVRLATVHLSFRNLLCCRAGHKMEAALNHFQIEVAGMTCLDAGLSTGGFTDSLLQNGARKVYGVDVGFGQV